MRPAQVTIREARSPNKPVLRWFSLVVLVLVIVGASIVLVRAQRIHAYGIVRAETVDLRAPFPGEVRQLSVRTGDPVMKGDPLLVITSSNVSDAERAAQEELGRRLEEQSRAFEESANLKRESEVRSAEAELARLTAAAREAEAERRGRADQARLEVEQGKALLAARTERYEKVKTLLEMDAAIASDLSTAHDAMRTAEFNLRQAESALALAETRVNPYEQQLDAARSKLDAARSGATSDQLLIEKARAELELAQRKFSPTEIAVEQGKLQLAMAQTAPRVKEYHALFDGVVMEVTAAEGSVVMPDEPLISVADASRKWIEVYTPVGNFEAVEPGRKIIIQIAGLDQPLEGTITAGGRAVVQTPSAILERSPRMKRSVYTRIDLGPDTPLAVGEVVRVVIPRDQR